MTGRAGQRGFGRIRKLPSGRWQASYMAPDLRRLNAPVTFFTKADAEGWLGMEERTPLGDARLRGSVRLLEHFVVSIDAPRTPQRWRLPDGTW